jgi:hypothetical protein
MMTSPFNQHKVRRFDESLKHRFNSRELAKHGKGDEMNSLTWINKEKDNMGHIKFKGNHGVMTHTKVFSYKGE